MAKYVRITNHKGKPFVLYGGMYGVYQKFKNLCKNASVPVDIIYGWRGEEEQNKLEAQGLSNAKFGSSPHNFGLAFDYWPLNKSGGFMQDTAISDYVWNKIGLIVEDCGLVWGGRFKSIIDKDHCENADWRTLSKNGECPLLHQEPTDIDSL